MYAGMTANMCGDDRKYVAEMTSSVTPAQAGVHKVTNSTYAVPFIFAASWLANLQAKP